MKKISEVIKKEDLLGGGKGFITDPSQKSVVKETHPRCERDELFDFFNRSFCQILWGWELLNKFVNKTLYLFNRSFLKHHFRYQNMVRIF